MLANHELISLMDMAVELASVSAFKTLSKEDVTIMIFNKLASAVEARSKPKQLPTQMQQPQWPFANQYPYPANAPYAR